MALEAVTDAEFEEKVLKAAKPVFVDYWAEWCSPCKQLAPIVAEIAEMHGDKMDFYKLDAQNNTETPTKYGIIGLPVLQVFKDGELVQQWTRPMSKNQLLKALAEWIG